MELQPVDFRFTLIVRGGVKSYELPNAPDGWEGSLITWARSKDFFGMLRSYTAPMKFVRDGATISRAEFYNYGIEANVQLKIELYNRSTWTYSEVYIGDINFATLKDSEVHVEVEIMEGGISKQIKAYENVKYEIDLNVPEAINVQLSPIKIAKSADFIFLETTPEQEPFTTKYFPAIQFITQEDEASTAETQSVAFGQKLPGPIYSTSTKWFFKAGANGPVTISGRLKGAIYSSFSNTTFTINIVKSNGAILSTIKQATPSPGQPPIVFDQAFSYDYTLTVGEKLFIFIDNTGGYNPSHFVRITEGTLKASYSTITAATFCKALRPKYIFDKLIEKMNEDVPYPTRSTLLNVDWKDLVLTSGDGIRQIADAKIITSFKDFFQSYNAVLNTGFGIESGKATLETKAYWMKNNLQAANIGEVKTFELEPAEDFIFNTIKAGYPDQTYDELNGREEVNSQQIWITPITRIQKELNLMSVFRSDPYGVEFIRTQLTGKSSTDAKSDNDCFFLYIKPDPINTIPDFPYYELETGDDFNSVTGITAGQTIYNARITPKRNLLRHGDYLHAFLDKLDGNRIKFASGLKNVELETVDQFGVKVKENANINISDLPEKLFLPYVATVRTKLPKNMLDIIDSKPTGYIAFTYRDKEYKGFIIEVSIDIARNSDRELKLLLTRSNDLSNLIH